MNIKYPWITALYHDHSTHAHENRKYRMFASGLKVWCGDGWEPVMASYQTITMFLIDKQIYEEE